ncbi:MAG: leucine-rich repeat domain-containing protein [Christensenellales bacterium]
MYDNNEEKISKKASEKAPDQGNIPDKLPCFLKSTKTKLAKAQLEQSKLQLQYVLYQNVQLVRVSNVNNTSGKVCLDIYEPREFEINGTELTKYKGKSKKVVIPYGVTSIGKKAFSNCSSLTNIIISDSVTSIGYWAFSDCVNLKSIIIPDSVTSIGSGVFYNCNSLTSITIPDSVTSIEWGAFSDCSSLTSITIPDSVTSIDEEAFFGCSSLTSITIPNSVTSIGAWAFDGTAWYNNQSDGLVYAGKVAYKYKGTMPDNTSIVIKEGTSGIAGYAFGGCSNLTSITIPNSVTHLENGAFSQCSSLTSINIPDGVTSIGKFAFSDCSSMTSITIPNSVTSIGVCAFSNCINLECIIFQGTKAQWNAITKGTKWKSGAGKFVVQYTE